MMVINKNKKLFDKTEETKTYRQRNEIKDLKTIKAIVFDLDGTLYEDTGHFTYYASRLRSKLPAERQKLFADDYKNVLNNKHILKIGRTYDVDRDLIILHADKVSAAYQWDGTRIPNEKLETLYPEPVSFDMEKMINIGDLWWVPAAIALHYGLNSKETYQAFLKTREYMKGPNYDINQVPGLREILSKLRNNLKLILMTNSPRPDSEAILDKLSLNSLFDLKIFNAGKPALTQKQFMKLSEKLEIDYPEILSIGDNYLNEILPAKQLGCKTIFIDSYKLGLEEEEEFYVKSCSQLVDYLQSLVI